MNISPESCLQLALIDHQSLNNWQELEIAYSLLMRNKKVWKGNCDFEDSVKNITFYIKDLKFRSGHD